MELQINSCPVDVEFQGENTILDIVSSVSGWARERDLIFTEAYINDTRYPVDRIPELPLDDVSMMNFIVQSRADICISGVNEVIIYCNKVISFIRGSLDKNQADIAAKEPLENGIDWLMDITNKLIQILSLDEEIVKYRDKNLKYYFETIKVFKKRIKNCEKSAEFLELLKTGGEIFGGLVDIYKFLVLSDNMKELVIQSVDSPDVLIKSIMNIRDELPVQIRGLEEAAIAFQSGKDDEGSSKLQSFIQFIYNYSRTCFQISPVFGADLSQIKIGDVSLYEKNKVIHDLLNQIVEVMENNDIISLSDILEYELRSALENLNLYIDLMINFIDSGR